MPDMPVTGSPSSAGLVVENGVDLCEVDAGTKMSIDHAMGRKRKIDITQDDSDDDDGVVAPPAHDIYRSRQQKKVR